MKPRPHDELRRLRAELLRVKRQRRDYALRNARAVRYATGHGAASFDVIQLLRYLRGDRTDDPRP